MTRYQYEIRWDSMRSDGIKASMGPGSGFRLGVEMSSGLETLQLCVRRWVTLRKKMRNPEEISGLRCGKSRVTHQEFCARKMAYFSDKSLNINRIPSSLVFSFVLVRSLETTNFLKLRPGREKPTIVAANARVKQ